MTRKTGWSFLGFIVIGGLLVASHQEDAKILAARLAGMNEPTVEQALVVPQFRVELADEQRQAAK